MTTAAQIFTILSGVVILFQACLIAGLPWGAASMGGKFPGKYPTRMRVVALLNIIILLFITAVVLSKANIILPLLKPFSQKAIWGVVVFSAAGTVMNTITPSRIERIWAPISLLLLITSLIVALH
jgi:hypothetical protein